MLVLMTLRILVQHRHVGCNWLTAQVGDTLSHLLLRSSVLLYDGLTLRTVWKSNMYIMLLSLIDSICSRCALRWSDSRMPYSSL